MNTEMRSHLHFIKRLACAITLFGLFLPLFQGCAGSATAYSPSKSASAKSSKIQKGPVCPEPEAEDSEAGENEEMETYPQDLEMPNIQATDPQQATRPSLTGANPANSSDASQTNAPGSQPQGQSSEVVSGDTPIKIATTLVTVPVIVSTTDNRYITDLRKGDFNIFEDRVEQEIDSFQSVETPILALLLLDTSGSTRFKIEQIRRAANAFVKQMRLQDQIAIVTFDGRIVIWSPFTNNLDQLHQAISQARTVEDTDANTRLYDAIHRVIHNLTGEQARKAIILLTDGVDTSSREATEGRTRQLVEESDVLVYTIYYDTSADTGGWNGNEYLSGRKYVSDLADISGGRFVDANSIGNLDQAFSLVALELKQQYWLSYYPTDDAKDGRCRNVRVTVNQPDLVVRARKRYCMPNDVRAQNSAGRSALTLAQQ